MKRDKNKKENKFTPEANFYDRLRDKVSVIVLERLDKNERILDIGCGTLGQFQRESQEKAKCIEGDAENMKDFMNEIFSASGK